jgi:hypothetical protein
LSSNSNSSFNNNSLAVFSPVVNGLPDWQVVSYTILAIAIVGVVAAMFWWCWRNGLTGSTLQILTNLAWIWDHLVSCWERLSPFWIQIRASLARIWIQIRYFCCGTPVQVDLTIDPSFPPNCSLVMEIGHPIAESTQILSGKMKFIIKFFMRAF